MGPPPEASIAVLPFVNMSGEPELEYFSDGISEELLNVLAKVPDLRVISRSSAFSFKDKNVATPEIARQLNVAHILEGSVRRDGNHVRITAQLIEARTDLHLWSETYDRTIDDIFAVQDEIAAMVVRQLKIELLDKIPTSTRTDTEAYTLYLQANHLINRGNADSLELATENLEKVLEIDPYYAPAWASLGDIYTNQAVLAWRPLAEGMQQAERAYLEAIRLRPQFPRAECNIGNILLTRGNDFQAAANRVMNGLHSAPNDVSCLMTAGRLLKITGQVDRSIEILEYALQFAPINSYLLGHLTVSYEVGRRWDDAIDTGHTLMALNPETPWVHAGLAMGYTMRRAPGDLDYALQVVARESLVGARLEMLSIVHFANGNHVESDAALAELIEKHTNEWAFNVGRVLAFRGEADRAFHWLETAKELGDSGLSSASVDPLLDSLHDDSRWVPFLESIGWSADQNADIDLIIDWID